MITTLRHPPPTPSPEAVAEPVIVVGQNYLAPYVIDLNVTRKMMMMLMEGTTISVNDIYGDQWFKVRGKMLSLRDRRVLFDVADNPLVTFQHKLLTAHRRWIAYRGDSTDENDVLFTVRQSSLIQVTSDSKTKLEVFMAHNMAKEGNGVCDFYVKGSCCETSCDIFIGGTKTMIAQMHRSQSFFSAYLGKDNFTMSIRPNVDYAFIVSLVVILEEINSERKRQELVIKSCGLFG
ncbi:unnamed protein product [Cuscuta epithymum]|uniref:Protein LURP-one-related 15 n=1 Tax=Cuscuta epithymum TaxID=186058 RepID=A0AAV0GGR3_9ASTE|nr:unnamed protein product [Cuscuta epithymum]